MRTATSLRIALLDSQTARLEACHLHRSVDPLVPSRRYDPLRQATRQNAGVTRPAEPAGGCWQYGGAGRVCGRAGAAVERVHSARGTNSDKGATAWLLV